MLRSGLWDRTIGCAVPVAVSAGRRVIDASVNTGLQDLVWRTLQDKRAAEFGLRLA